MKKASVLILLAVLVFTMTGCGISIPTEDGGSFKLTKDGVQVEGSDGSKATISDSGDGDFVMETSEGKVEVGENLDLPKGYPKDIAPLYKEESILTSASSETGEFSVTYRSKASLKDCSDYYKDFYKDAESISSAGDENGGSVLATLKERAVAVITQPDTDDNKKTVVVITIGAPGSNN